MQKQNIKMYRENRVLFRALAEKKNTETNTHTTKLLAVFRASAQYQCLFSREKKYGSKHCN